MNFTTADMFQVVTNRRRCSTGQGMKAVGAKAVVQTCTAIKTGGSTTERRVASAAHPAAREGGAPALLI